MNAEGFPPAPGGAAPFSWSLRRRRIFDRCPREYFFHYLGSAGGADPFAPPEVRRLHRLRNMPDTAGFVNRLLTGTLREFFSGGAADGEFFRSAV